MFSDPVQISKYNSLNSHNPYTDLRKLLYIYRNIHTTIKLYLIKLINIIVRYKSIINDKTKHMVAIFESHTSQYKPIYTYIFKETKVLLSDQNIR